MGKSGKQKLDVEAMLLHDLEDADNKARYQVHDSCSGNMATDCASNHIVWQKAVNEAQCFE